MTLNELSVALASNTNLMVTIVDGSANTLVKYNAAGYEAIDASVMARNVNKVTITGQFSITVVIAE